MTLELNYPHFKRLFCFITFGLLTQWSTPIYAQDTTKSILDINNSKLVKKANQFLDSNQKKINNFFNSKMDAAKDGLTKKTNSLIDKTGINEIDKPLPYERLLNKKYTLGRRAYQNTVSQFNYLFNADESLNEIIQKARDLHEDDFTELLPFYDYDLSITAKESIDSIIYRCNANIVLHDLRSNYVDDAYLMLAKAYLFHKNFDTAASILQFINYSFYDKEAGADLPIGSNINKTGKFSIASVEDGRAWENKNVRNESMIWQARNYFEAGELNEGVSLLELLKTDAGFPKRLHPFLYEQLAYGYYQSGNYLNAANNLIKGLDNAKDMLTRARWTFLIAQMYEKEQKIDLAYNWYKKAGSIASNPIIAVYASIYRTSIEANRGEKSWETLANSLERMLNRDKFKPYADIIYYEMAQLAYRNKATAKSNQWLVASIQKNESNNKLKQKALIQLGNINYQIDQFTIANIAYDQINNLLKSYPNYDQITLRKKWLAQIASQDELIRNEDSLQWIYTFPKKEQKSIAINWQKRVEKANEQSKNLFTNQAQKNESEVSKNDLTKNAGYTFSNAFASNNKQAPKSDFYFDNPQTISAGSSNFIRKWGDRPNVDNWRRKTSIQLNRNNNTNILLLDSLKKETLLGNSTSNDQIKKEGFAKKDSSEILKIKLIESEDEYVKSQMIWNKHALSIAKIFLYELNDFEKALPRYQKIIQKNIDSATTESALLDLASHYIHVGQKEKSDLIIQEITRQFPNGIYVSKKKAKEQLEKMDKNATDNYKENYFIAQIGDWDSFNSKMEDAQKQFKGTKWQIPYQFLKVKMYAQQSLDSLALVQLNQIISLTKSEPIKAKARDIITEINNRKTTEAYLAALKITKPIKPILVEEIAENQSKGPSESIKKDSGSIANNKKEANLVPKKDSAASLVSENQLVFSNDSLEQHYIALQTFNVAAVFVKEIQNAMKDFNTEYYKRLNLNVTYVQFTEQSHLVWIGPFTNASEGLLYLQKVKPRLSTEIISFIAKNQYDLTLIGKSNIIQVNNQEQLDQYKRYKSTYYFKP